MRAQGWARDQGHLPIGVVVIAGTRLYREGLVGMLGRHARVEVLGSAPDVLGGIEQAIARRADVLLLDVGTPGASGELRRIGDAVPEARVVVFAIADSEEVVIRCAEAGAAGYVPREATLAELVAILEGVMHDELVCPPRIAGTLLRRVCELAREKDPEATDEVVRLTSREMQIVGLIDEGLSNKEIAARLQIELPTVKNHVHHVLDKLGVSRRGEAAARVRSLRRVG
jgi:two-component system, NarL family, nitrate/nitrite response regulator NarL